MHHVTHDGAALAAACVGPGVASCTVCHAPLTGAEPYWMTEYPRGEHTRCRQWRRHPYPFLRQIGVLRRLWRMASSEGARQELVAAGRWLTQQAARWPEQASAEMVVETLARLRSLRMVLNAHGLDRKLVGQL
ncbi:MAG: hypothetical protein AB2A00_27810 [Myxococcota bacterium]